MRTLRQSQCATIGNISESDIISAISCNIRQNLDQVSVLNSIQLKPCFRQHTKDGFRISRKPRVAMLQRRWETVFLLLFFNEYCNAEQRSLSVWRLR